MQSSKNTKFQWCVMAILWLVIVFMIFCLFLFFIQDKRVYKQYWFIMDPKSPAYVSWIVKSSTVSSRILKTNWSGYIIQLINTTSKKYWVSMLVLTWVKASSFSWYLSNWSWLLNTNYDSKIYINSWNVNMDFSWLNINPNSVLNLRFFSNSELKDWALSLDKSYLYDKNMSWEILKKTFNQIQDELDKINWKFN